MLVFVKNLFENKNETENLFDLNRICLLYFENDDEEKSELIGSYPGQINNFLLVGNCDFWIDPKESYSNTYLSKDLRENADYLIISGNLYQNIKDVFGTIKFNEIERKTVVNQENELHVEVNLAKVLFKYLNI